MPTMRIDLRPKPSKKPIRIPEWVKGFVGIIALLVLLFILIDIGENPNSCLNRAYWSQEPSIHLIITVIDR